MAKWVKLTGAADRVLREMKRATAERRDLPFDLYVEGYKNGTLNALARLDMMQPNTVTPQ